MQLVSIRSWQCLLYTIQNRIAVTSHLIHHQWLLLSIDVAVILLPLRSMPPSPPSTPYRLALYVVVVIISMASLNGPLALVSTTAAATEKEPVSPTTNVGVSAAGAGVLGVSSRNRGVTIRFQAHFLLDARMM
jgi:hypothetical protein